MADDVTTGEIVRRLDSIAAQLASIVNSLEADRRHNTETFVRKDVYENGLVRRVTELEEDRDTQRDRNRQLGIAILSGAVLIVLSLVISLMRLGAGGV